MKIEEQMTAAYEAPMVEVIEVEVEKGFATSAGPGESNIEDWPNV